MVCKTIVVSLQKEGADRTSVSFHVGISGLVYPVVSQAEKQQLMLLKNTCFVLGLCIKINI